jgi:rhodanese-related sulfurtransferase
MGKHSPRFLALVMDAQPRVPELTACEVNARMKKGPPIQLIDVREDHEWTQQHIPGARHLGKGIIERDIERLIPDKEADLVLYCGGGFRSILAADNLIRMGYKRVISMAGGIRGWLDSGFAVEQGVLAVEDSVD